MANSKAAKVRARATSKHRSSSSHSGGAGRGRSTSRAVTKRVVTKGFKKTSGLKGAPKKRFQVEKAGKKAGKKKSKSAKRRDARFFV